MTTVEKMYKTYCKYTETRRDFNNIKSAFNFQIRSDIMSLTMTSDDNFSFALVMIYRYDPRKPEYRIRDSWSMNIKFKRELDEFYSRNPVLLMLCEYDYTERYAIEYAPNLMEPANKGSKGRNGNPEPVHLLLPKTWVGSTDEGKILDTGKLPPWKRKEEIVK